MAKKRKRTITRGELLSLESALKMAGVVPFNPDEFLRKKGAKTETYAKLLADPMAKAAILRKVFDVVQRDWTVAPADLPSDALDEMKLRAKAVAAGIEYIFRNFITPTSAAEGPLVIGASFRHLLLELMRAPTAGHSIVETALELFTWGQLSGKIGLRSTKGKDPDKVGLVTDEFGNVSSVRRLYDGKDFAWDGFLIFPYCAWLANAWGVSDLRSVYRATWMKENLWRFISVFFERAGMGFFPTITMPLEPESPQIAAAEDILKKLRTDIGITMPEGFDLEFKEIATGGADAMDRAIERLDREILTGILGASHQQLVAEKGARSLGEIHDEVAKLFIAFAASSVLDVINEQLVPRLVDLNWSDAEAYPRVVFQEAIDLGETSTVDTALVAMGWKPPVAYITDRYARPVAKDGEPVLEPPAPAAPAGLPGLPPFSGPGGGAKKEGRDSVPFFGAHRPKRDSG